MEKEKIPISKEDALRIDFSFFINYSNSSAKLEFQGIILILPEGNEMKEFLKEWKDQKLPEESRVHIFNFILAKCNIKALTLEDDLNLPPHVPMPRLTKEIKE